MPKITKSLVDKLEAGGKTLWDAELLRTGLAVGEPQPVGNRAGPARPGVD